MKLDTRTTATLMLPPGKTDQIFFDDELRGFGLRLRRRGNRLHSTWIAQYRVDGRQRRVTLGALAVVRPNEARDAARKLLAKASLGSDPQGEKEERRRVARHTFRAAVASYLELRERDRRPVTFRHLRTYLTGPYFRPLHATALGTINHADIAACIRTVESTNGKSAARCAWSAVSGLFGWAIAEGLMLPPNPVDGTRRPPPPSGRDRVLSGTELATLWNAVGSDHEYDRVMRLLILTGARRSEIGDMRWSELDLDAGTWTLPKERSKNHRAHTIVLPEAAREIIRAIKRREGRDFLFGTFGVARGFTSWTIAKLDLGWRLAGTVQPWRTHDIRRSVATGMADIGIAPHVIEAVLNHFSGHRAGVAGVYNRSRYHHEVTAALARWAEHMLALAEGRADKVIALRA